ncbi:hypothetical protein [Aliidiomarina celeris]|uniref:hypothetical protein n=1 Tax=Aliidiomarina celeris TaxID=2249428 RepID=UPI000DE95AD7|nr:hypothetical protein [Aliidiomarina celeris]
MRFINVVVACLFVLASSLATNAWAQALTDTQINRFIASFEELTTVESVSQAFDEMEDDRAGDDAVFFADLLDNYKEHPSYAEFSRIIRSHGFESTEQWATVSDRIVKAVITHEVNKQRPQMEAEIESMLEELGNNEYLSAEMKAQFEQQARSQLAQMQGIWSAPEADVNAIQPHLAKLREVFEFDDEDF